MSLLETHDLRVDFPVYAGNFVRRPVGHVHAVAGVSIKVERGQTYGLVGESGCGKSTFGRALLRLIEPTAGQVIFDGQDLGALGAAELRRMRRRMQMIFQDPLSSLDPRQTVESALLEPLQIHGLLPERGQRTKKIARLLDSVGLPRKAAKRYPHEFSGGQRQRIGIARAIALEPDLIIADEAVSALDVSVQAQILNLLEDLQDELNLTYVFIAHNLAVVRHISDVVGVMYLGKLVEQSTSDDLYASPLHPYTKALLNSVPHLDPEAVAGVAGGVKLTGELPSPMNPPSGCSLHPRCPYAKAGVCDVRSPELRPFGARHVAACHRVEEIMAGAPGSGPAGPQLSMQSKERE